MATTGLAKLADAYRLGGSDPRSRMQRAWHHKSWVYLFAATPEVSVVAALVNGGITGSAFLMVTDLQNATVLADSSRKGARAKVNDAPGDGLRASYRLPGTRYRLRRDSETVSFTASLGRAPVAWPGVASPWLDVDLSLREMGTGVTAISEVDHGLRTSVSVTGKTAVMPVTGQVVVHAAGGRRTFRLDGGLGGYDYTSGLLLRRTSWRWAYGVGRLADRTPVGFNLTEGFSGVGDRSYENAAWIDGRPAALDSRVSFTFDRGDLSAPWQITTGDGAVRLHFVPVAVHDEHLDLKVVSSRFRQPVGHFRGQIDVGGRTYDLDQIPGVTEDQDVMW